MGNVYGYVRVSGIDQNEDRQLIVMDENNVPKSNVYVDKQAQRIFCTLGAFIFAPQFKADFLQINISETKLELFGINQPVK